MEKTEKITLLAGPTASGKSDLAIQIAQKTNGVIINADALQVYEAYEVLTARPPKSDLAKADHLLYGHVSNSVLDYSVGAWLREVRDIIASEPRPKIFVGGTGLYFDALLNGISEIPKIEPETRQSLEQELKDRGLAALLEELKEVDRASYDRMDLDNHRRVTRALEVFRQTGCPLSEWQNSNSPSIINNYKIIPIVLCPEKEVLNDRIARRFDAMLNAGALAEVKTQMNPWDENAPANKAIGAKEIVAYLSGDCSLEAANEQAVIATRQYAKRQRSWFRSRMKDWLWAEDAQQALELWQQNYYEI